MNNLLTTIVFCGVWPGRAAGHFSYLPNGEWPKTVTPWGGYGWSVCDGDVIAQMPDWRHPVEALRQPEGVRYRLQKAGWTMVCWWDRSADPRHGSIAAFAMEGDYSADEAEKWAREAPIGTVTTQDHHSLVAAFLQKYHGSTGQNQDIGAPLHTIDCKARYGLVTVDIQGEPWALTDIRMRMLEPRELARAQGFPDSYHLEGSKADQIAGIGNSVVPQVMAALVWANFGRCA